MYWMNRVLIHVLVLISCGDWRARWRPVDYPYPVPDTGTVKIPGTEQDRYPGTRTRLTCSYPEPVPMGTLPLPLRVTRHHPLATAAAAVVSGRSTWIGQSSLLVRPPPESRFQSRGATPESLTWPHPLARRRGWPISTLHLSRSFVASIVDSSTGFLIPSASDTIHPVTSIPVAWLLDQRQDGQSNGPHGGVCPRDKSSGALPCPMKLYSSIRSPKAA